MGIIGLEDNPLMRFASYRNIFSGEEDPYPDQPTYSGTELGSPGQPPEGPATKAYREFLSAPPPKREDFHPSKMDRLGSVLAGVSAGAQGKNGYETGSSILDKPYNDALGDYILRDRQLGTAAHQEQALANSGFKNSIAAGTLDLKSRSEGRLEGVANARIADYGSKIKQRDNELTSKGYTPTTNTAGERIYTRIGANGMPEVINTGIKVRETGAERRAGNLSNSLTLEGVRQGNRNSLFNHEEDVRKANQIDAENRAQARVLSKEDRAKADREARDKKNPNRQFAARAIVYRDLISENPAIKNQFDLEKMTHTPQVDALVKEEMKKRGYQ